MRKANIADEVLPRRTVRYSRASTKLAWFLPLPCALSLTQVALDASGTSRIAGGRAARTVPDSGMAKLDLLPAAGFRACPSPI